MESLGSDTKIESIKNWLGTGSINIFGLPFAGKDTHCRELAELFGGVVIGGGDILRSKGTPSHIQDHIARGSLAPTEDYMKIVLPYFAREEFKNKPLILSSVGRWHGEEAGILEATGQSRHPLLAVIHLAITPEEMQQRWQEAQKLGDRGHRRDDAEHILETRVAEFNSKTTPVIEFYKGQGMLVEVDGTKSKEEVSKIILDGLYARASATSV